MSDTMSGVLKTNLAQPDHTLEKLFAPQPQGYLGADVGLSIPIDEQRVLWIFGDTLQGDMTAGRRRVEAMPRNSAALVSRNASGPDDVQWLGVPAQDHFIPPDGQDERWFWPGTGFAHAGKVYLIGYEVVQGTGPCESLSFAITGSRLFRISHIDRSPVDWRMESFAFPSMAPDAFFCSAQLIENGFVHLLGFTRLGGKEESESAGAMARFPLQDLASNDPGEHMEVLTGDKPHWAPFPQRPHPIIRPGVSECSLYHDTPRSRYLATTYDPRDGVMSVTTAAQFEGPWSKSIDVYRVPEFRGWERHHAYTFRMHPYLASSPDEMVFTYVVNTKSLETVLDELDVYYPRFLRLDLRLL